MGALDLPLVDGKDGVLAHEAGNDVRPPGDGGQQQVSLDISAHRNNSLDLVAVVDMMAYLARRLCGLRN